MPETNKFQASRRILVKQFGELFWPEPENQKAEGAQYKLNTGCGSCQNYEFSRIKILRQTSYF